MGRFDQYLDGKVEITVGDQDLVLQPTLKHKQLFKRASVAKDDQKFALLDDAMLAVLKHSYPDEDAKALEAFYSKHDLDFLKEFTIAMGLAKRSDFEETPKNPN